jgi:hypothetical protein
MPQAGSSAGPELYFVLLKQYSLGRWYFAILADTAKMCVGHGGLVMPSTGFRTSLFWAFISPQLVPTVRFIRSPTEVRSACWHSSTVRPPYHRSHKLRMYTKCLSLVAMHGRLPKKRPTVDGRVDCRLIEETYPSHPI